MPRGGRRIGYVAVGLEHPAVAEPELGDHAQAVAGRPGLPGQHHVVAGAEQVALPLAPELLGFDVPGGQGRFQALGADFRQGLDVQDPGALIVWSSGRAVPGRPAGPRRPECGRCRSRRSGGPGKCGAGCSFGRPVRGRSCRSWLNSPSSRSRASLYASVFSARPRARGVPARGYAAPPRPRRCGGNRRRGTGPGGQREEQMIRHRARMSPILAPGGWPVRKKAVRAVHSGKLVGLTGIWLAGSRSSTWSTRPYSWASRADMKLSRSVSRSIRSSGWPVSLCRISFIVFLVRSSCLVRITMSVAGPRCRPAPGGSSPRACGRALRLPLVPAASSVAAMLAAMPMQYVATSQVT